MLTKEEFYIWLRRWQPTGKLTQTQVDAMELLLAVVRPDVLQKALAQMNGWITADSTTAMSLSHKGSELIKGYERFVGHPYRDMVGRWTIGYGNTYYPDGRKVTQYDKHITEPEAAKLKQDIINLDFSPGVNKIFADEIRAGMITQNMFDALISLSYNIGVPTLATSKSITAKIKAGRIKEAADGFLKFNNGTVKGKFGPIEGLTIRRQKEKDLFLS